MQVQKQMLENRNLSICTSEDGFSIRPENKQTAMAHDQHLCEPLDEQLDETNNHKSHNKTQKCDKKKIKRGKKKHNVQSLNIFSSNAAQLRGKLESFHHELKVNNASVFTLQETHFSKKVN